ncbi:MAG: tetratricopeptide repeat protein [Candidatus Thorarchaeota archaeon]
MTTDIDDLPREILIRYLELCEKGEKHMANSEFRLAIDCFLEAMEITVPCEDTWGKIALCYMQSDEEEESVRALLRALKINPDHVPTLHNLAMMLTDMNKLEEAEILIRRALKQDDTMPDLWYRLGVILCHKEEYHEALESLQTAHDSGIRDAEIHRHLGICFTNLQKAEEAEESFLQALNLAPGEIMPLLDYGRFLAEAKRYDEAEDYLRKAVAVRPDWHTAIICLADVLLRKVKSTDTPEDEALLIDEADTLLKMAFPVAEHEGKTWFHLAEVAMLKQQWDEAVKRSRRSIELGYRQPSVYTMIYHALKRSGRPVEAQMALQECWRQRIQATATRLTDRDTEVRPSE